MELISHEMEPATLFAESSIWQSNRDYYEREGITAWQSKAVPHNMTSSSTVGKTYAEIILGVLRDRAAQGKTSDVVYILELGAGHGRLGWHVLKHLAQLTSHLAADLPPYCYILSDIGGDNLEFFREHAQLQPYYEAGVLDLCYYDLMSPAELVLQVSGVTIELGALVQPLITIANYVFDSIPTDLFHIHDGTAVPCAVSLHSDLDPQQSLASKVTAGVELRYHLHHRTDSTYVETGLGAILEDYVEGIEDSYVFIPGAGIRCLEHLQSLSAAGAILLCMDKGYQLMSDLDRLPLPELIWHGSCSIWVNFHALALHAQQVGGAALFPSYSTFSSQTMCLFLVEDVALYTETAAAYKMQIDGFGPDDFNGVKAIMYKNLAALTLRDLIGAIRLTRYDSTFFINVLSQIRAHLSVITVEERWRLQQTFVEVWGMYFDIGEDLDLAYELGGMDYDLGYYEEALLLFAQSTARYGLRADVAYNAALCHYQLKQDLQFVQVKDAAQLAFPLDTRLDHLDELDLTA